MRGWRGWRGWKRGGMVSLLGAITDKVHEILQVRQCFTAWFPYHASRFTIGEDYAPEPLAAGFYPKSDKNKKAGRPRKEYRMSLGMCSVIAASRVSTEARELLEYLRGYELLIKSAIPPVSN